MDFGHVLREGRTTGRVRLGQGIRARKSAPDVLLVPRDRTFSRATQPEIGRRLRQLRDSAGLSRAKLAKLTGLSEATIKLIESGHTPSSRTLTRLANVPGFASLVAPVAQAELRVLLPDEETAQLLRRLAPLLGLAPDPEGVLRFPSVRLFALLAVLALFAPELLTEFKPSPKTHPEL